MIGTSGGSSNVLLNEAKVILRGNLALWSENSSLTSDWPSCTLKAKYKTRAIATTPEQAFNKYHEENVLWDFAYATARNIVTSMYDNMVQAEKQSFECWLRDQPKAAELRGYFFENDVEILMTSMGGDVEVKALKDNRGAKDLESLLGTGPRKKEWSFTPCKEVQHPSIPKVQNGFDIAHLKHLTDPLVLYRLPPGFPLMDYFNPPNNCFSVRVGKKHPIDLRQTLKLCKDVIPSDKQINLFTFALQRPSRR